MPNPQAPSPTSTTAFDLQRIRDLRGRTHHPWVRRAILAALTVLIVVALSGRLGQTEHVTTATSAAARVDLRAPSTLRGGLMWRARITVRARTRLIEPQLVLGAGYVSGMQLNTLEPAPADEGNEDDSLALTYATLDAGDELVVYLQLQVNPETRGRQDLSVVLRGGGSNPPSPARLRASTVVLP